MTKNLRVIADASDTEPEGSVTGATKEVIHAGARTPEELEALFEDTLMIRDGETLSRLFEDGALLIVGDALAASGSHELVRLALANWSGDNIYVANPQQVIQARDLALIVSEQALNVARRGPDGTWRFVILLIGEDDAERNDHDTRR